MPHSSQQVPQSSTGVKKTEKKTIEKTPTNTTPAKESRILHVVKPKKADAVPDRSFTPIKETSPVVSMEIEEKGKQTGEHTNEQTTGEEMLQNVEALDYPTLRQFVDGEFPKEGVPCAFKLIYIGATPQIAYSSGAGSRRYHLFGDQTGIIEYVAHNDELQFKDGQVCSTFAFILT